MAQTENGNEQGAERSKLEQGGQLFVLALLNIGGYELAEGNAGEQRMFALLTVTLAVASLDNFMTHFRGRGKD